MTTSESALPSTLLDTYLTERIGEFRGRLPFFMVESMLRLGNKYGITHLEEEALFRLHHDYPQDLMTWDALLNEVVQPFIESNDVEDVTWVIDTAHEFHLNTILPAAYSTLIKRIQSMVCASLIIDQNSSVHIWVFPIGGNNFCRVFA